MFINRTTCSVLLSFLSLSTPPCKKLLLYQVPTKVILSPSRPFIPHPHNRLAIDRVLLHIIWYQYTHFPKPEEISLLSRILSCPILSGHIIPLMHPFQRQKKDKWKGYKNEKKKDKNDPPPPTWFFFYATSFRKRNGLEKGKEIITGKYSTPHNSGEWGRGFEWNRVVEGRRAIRNTNRIERGS